MTLARKFSPPTRVTVSSSDFSAKWLLVMMYPSGLTMKPVPWTVTRVSWRRWLGLLKKAVPEVVEGAAFIRGGLCGSGLLQALGFELDHGRPDLV